MPIPRYFYDKCFTSRNPPPGVIHHPDLGSQDMSRLYRAALKAGGAVPSMGRKGDCSDNAVLESFFATLKRELLLENVFHTRQEGRGQVYEHLEAFYNRQRRHSTLGYRTPLEFEQLSNRAVAYLQVRGTRASSRSMNVGFWCASTGISAFVEVANQASQGSIQSTNLS